MLANLRERARLPLMLLPSLAVVLILFSGGLILGFMQSLGYLPAIGQYDLSFKAYRHVFADPAFLRGLLLTCWLGFTTTILSMILATVCALVLRQRLRGKRIVSFIFQFNIPVPHILGAIAVLLLLSQSGLVSRFTHHLGLTEQTFDFPVLVNDKNGLGIMLEYLWKTIPFTGVILLAVLQSVGDDYENLARTLGANQWQRFRYVILPLIMPGLLRSSILVFAFAFGAFEVPFLLGQSFPLALPVLAFEYYKNVDLGYRAEAMAISMVIAGLITLLILAYMKLTETFVRSD